MLVKAVGVLEQPAVPLTNPNPAIQMINLFPLRLLEKDPFFETPQPEHKLLPGLRIDNRLADYINDGQDTEKCKDAGVFRSGKHIQGIAGL